MPASRTPRSLVAALAAAALSLASTAVVPAHANDPVPNLGLVAVPPGACPSGCVFDVDVPAPAEVTLPASTDGRPSNRVRVILPVGYSDAVDHPSAYLLHGAGDGSETWVTNTDVADFVADSGLDVIVVMPDGGGKRSESGWYSDWADGSRDWETFHLGVVLPWVDAHLATIADRDHRAVLGLSMGGFGAMSYAGRHPDLFSAAASFSGAVDTKALAPVSGYGFAAAHPYFGTPDSRVWGPQGTMLDDDEWAAHNPADLARDGALRALDGNLWLTTGTGTPGGPAGDDPANPGGYAVEQVIFDMNTTFRAALVTSDTPYHDLSYLGGLHDWAHWQHALHLVLPDVVASIS